MERVRPWKRYAAGIVLVGGVVSAYLAREPEGVEGTARRGAGAAGIARLAPPAEAPAPPPRLTVVIAVDQLPTWSFARDRHYLTGGVGRLLREGVYFPEGQFPYASTYTAPGHACLGTGAPPAVSGILANEWYRPDLGREVAATHDPDAPVFQVAGPPKAGEGASPRALAVEGIADALRRGTGGRGRSVTVGLKARAAILFAGRRPDLAVWYDPDQAAMTTSAYYADRLPAWLRARHEQAPVSDYFDDVWAPIDGALLATVTGRPDEGIGEGGHSGLDSTFPHALAESNDPAVALRATPMGTDLVLATARAAIEAENLGADDVPDLLAVTISSHDYAGHIWGQESWERLDLLLRFDRQLGAFLRHLDDEIGADRYAVVLTSDHGATPLVESHDHEGARVSPEHVMRTAERAARSVLGPGDWIARRSASSLYLEADDIGDGDRDRALEAVADALRALDGIGFAAPTDSLRGGCEDREGLAALACRSVGEDSGDVFCAPEPYSIITGYPTGTSHGSPNDHDRTVPIVVRAPGWTPGIVSEPVSMLRVAPTVAAILGVPPPEAAHTAALSPPDRAIAAGAAN